MTLEMAILHILTVHRRLQNTFHWQIVARVALDSLYEDSRVSEAIYESIINEIQDGTLLRHNHMLRSKE